VTDRHNYNIAVRAGYSASFSKEAGEGIMGSIVSGFNNEVLTDENIEKFAPKFSPEVKAMAPIFQSPTGPPPGLLQEKGRPSISSMLEYATAPTVKDRPATTPTYRYSPYGPVGNSGGRYAVPPARIYNSEAGGGKYIRYNPNAADAKHVFKNYIQPRYPHAKQDEVGQLAAYLGNRLPIGEGAKETAFRTAFADARKAKDYDKMHHLATYVKHSPYREGAKKELLQHVRSKVSGTVQKAAPWVAGAAALTPLAMLLMSKTKSAAPQQAPKAVTPRQPSSYLSESMYRQLGQNLNPTRLT